MAAAPRQAPPRLHIPPHMNQIPLNGQPMFSPVLPTAIHNGIPTFQLGPLPMQTPLQNSFFPPGPPGAPGRPQHLSHKARASMAQLAGAGMMTPQGMPMTPGPMTPLGGGFPMLGGPGFAPRNRRAPSVSLGGPPKAVLGGPSKKEHTPIPVPKVLAQATAPPAPKPKKVLINLPKETVAGEDGAPSTRSSFARSPLPSASFPAQPRIHTPELTTSEALDDDHSRYGIPDTVDVFLPGRSSWDALKHKSIEEKLQKMGIEKGSGMGSSIPHIHAPHARAASISSPADPALLLFKLQKLQLSQSHSATEPNSLSTSPQPPTLSPSPGALPARFQKAHGHSQSLAVNASFYNPLSAFNPFGPNATLGSDQIIKKSLSPESTIAPLQTIHAPQGRVPVTADSLAPPLVASRPESRESRPDFSRGFGIEIPEEEEPPEEDNTETLATDIDEKETLEPIMDDMATQFAQMDAPSPVESDSKTASQSRVHSRHVSKLSAALSLLSVGGTQEDGFIRGQMGAIRSVGGRSEVVSPEDHDAVAEWSGTEDVAVDEDLSDDEGSLGEFSNPSDEERARQQRMHRRMMRSEETPRRLPNFPRPPDTFAELSVPGGQSETDDDLISNPSEEGHHGDHLAGDSTYYSQSFQNMAQGRPLPPVPHSRSTSGQYSYHDPALAHSRHTSEQFSAASYPGAPRIPPASTSLNPSAKPFTIGAPRVLSDPSNTVALDTHSRLSSWGKPLSVGASEFKPGNFNVAAPEFKPSFNIAAPEFKPSFNVAAPEFKPKPFNVAAPEFKPGNFTFRPPEGAPQMPAPRVEARPLPEPPAGLPGRAEQGREKRQRRASLDSLDDDDNVGNISMQSFRFPPPVLSDSPKPQNIVRRPDSAPTSPNKPTHTRRTSSLNADAPPFTFSGFSGIRNFMPQEQAGQSFLPPMVPTDTANTPTNELETAGLDAGQEADDEGAPTDVTTMAENGDASGYVDELPIPPQFKPKRAPIPLDFKHPISTTTVPASLFKGLANGTTSRHGSRLASRDFLGHSPMQSLDNIHVMGISHKVSHNNLANGSTGVSPHASLIHPPSPPKPLRPASLPTHSASSSSSGSGSSLSEASDAQKSRHQDLIIYERRLAALLEEKLGSIRRDIAHARANTSGVDNETQAMIEEVVSLFRAQLQESATRGLEDGQAQARGEMDLMMIKEMIDEGNRDSRAALQHDLTEALRRLEYHHRESGNHLGRELIPVMQELSGRTIEATIRATTQLGQHFESMSLKSPLTSAMERESLVMELVQALQPRFQALISDPVDYDALTTRLTQAVKPHISQLIDLASDKKETADLIVKALGPLLPKLGAKASVDTASIKAEIGAEVRKVLASIDPHEMKEQVSELVVERLDSRLAVRDRAFNMDTIAAKVSEAVSALQAPLQDVHISLGKLVDSQKAQSTDNQDVVGLLGDLPSQLAAATNALNAAQVELNSKAAVRGGDGISPKMLQSLEASIHQLHDNQRNLVSQNSDLVALHHDTINSMDALPDVLINAVKILEGAHTDMMSRESAIKREFDEVRKIMGANAEMQTQLAKARSAHGSIRVEKDMLNERLMVAEKEREHLRSQVEDSRASFLNKNDELTAAQIRNKELEVALTQALERLKVADDSTEKQQDRIADLEKHNRELGADKQQLKSKIDSLELQHKLITRDKEAAEHALAQLRKEHERVLPSQENWENLRRASEQIELLSTLVRQADDEEVKELRKIRDRSQTLETDHAALQKRFKDQEARVATTERAAFTARQSLSQAQQRASEWEKRAKEREAEVKQLKSKYEDAEQARSQLDAEHSLAKLQLEEKDAHDRLSKDRESKLRDQVAALEERMARMQVEVDEAKEVTKKAVPSRLANGTSVNGSSLPTPRSESRTSTVYHHRDRSVTPIANGRPSSRASTVRTATPPSQLSVWDSMHAPKRYPSDLGIVTPKARRPQPANYPRRSMPSPTPSITSVVSNAPTLGDDGWWS